MLVICSTKQPLAQLKPVPKRLRGRSCAARTYCDATAQITSSWLRQEDCATRSELIPGHRRCIRMADRIRSMESRKYASGGPIPEPTRP
jgi:hypothetical protein